MGCPFANSTATCVWAHSVTKHYALLPDAASNKTDKKEAPARHKVGLL
jgi:hypothetical protein